MSTQVAVVFNPRSFRVPFLKQRFRRVLQYLKLHSRLSVLVLEPGQRGRDLARQAVRRGAEVLVAAGGDGTFREVALVGAEAGRPVGLLPLGATNVLTFELGLPRNLLEAARVILEGRPRRLDLGFADDEPFVLMMGVGFDAFVVHSLISPAKRAFGPQGYVITGLVRAPAYRYPAFRVQAEAGPELVAYQAVVSNCRYYGGRFWFAPEARPDDGLLDLVALRHRGLPWFLAYALAVVGHRIHRMPGVRRLRGRRFRLEGAGVPYHLDSEPVGTLPAEVTIRPGVLQVLVP